MPHQKCQVATGTRWRWRQLAVFRSPLKRQHHLASVDAPGLPSVAPLQDPSCGTCCTDALKPICQAALSWALTPVLFDPSVLCVGGGPMYSALSSEHDTEDVSAKNGNRLEMLHPSRYSTPSPASRQIFATDVATQTCCCRCDTCSGF